MTAFNSNANASNFGSIFGSPSSLGGGPSLSSLLFGSNPAASGLVNRISPLGNLSSLTAAGLARRNAMRNEQNAAFQRPPFLNQLGTALFSDIQNQQQAAAAQNQLTAASLQGFEQAVGGIQQRTDQITAQATQPLLAEADALEARSGQQVADTQQFTDQFLGDVREQIDLANQRADAAVQGFERSIAAFERRGQEEVSALAGGIRRSAQNEMQRIQSGVNPDGSLMTPEQRAAAGAQLMDSVDSQVFQQVAQSRSAFQNAALNARSQLAQVGLGAASTAISGGQVLAGAGAEAGRQLLQSQAQADAMRQVSTSLRSMSSQIQNANQMSAVQLELQGRQTLAQLIQSNPFSTVSVFAGLTALFQLASAPGANRIGGISPAALQGF